MALKKSTAIKEAGKKFSEQAAAKVETSQSYTLRQVKSEQKKGLIFGPIGSGKTLTAVAGALLYGENVLAISTDFGGQGLTSVVQYLEDLVRAGKLPENTYEDILDNRFVGQTLSTFDEVAKFLIAPETVVKELAAGFEPGLDVWDGFSYYQQTMVDQYAWQAYPDESQSFPRWGEVLRVTMRNMGAFLALKHGDKTPHKIITTIEDKQDVNEFTKKAQIAPMLNTKAKELSGGGFDLVVNTFVEDGAYKYRSSGDSGKYAVKSRGIKIPPVMDADPLLLWKALIGEVDLREDKNDGKV